VAHVKNAYGLFVVGESMAPEFDPGDIALVNPILPAMAGKPCIFYAEKDGEARATIKRYQRATADKWHVYQHNPPRGGTHEFTLSRKEWSICHRVLGKYYPQ
ncbi:MAG: S24 family peptidase, partial [Afipia sp.]|nr:S24 family peptidase [Afipia sp.]